MGDGAWTICSINEHTSNATGICAYNEMTCTFGEPRKCSKSNLENNEKENDVESDAWQAFRKKPHKD